jgi:hypothetical protein
MECDYNLEYDEDDHVSLDGPDETASATSANCPTQNRPRTPAPRTARSLLFTPTVFTVDIGTTDFSVRPEDLVQHVAREDLSVSHLSLERLWAEIETRTGSTSTTHRLIADVPGKCGQPSNLRDMRHKNK